MEGLTQKSAAILNDTESSKEGFHFVQVLLKWTTGSARFKPQIREAFHTWLYSVFCFMWGFWGVFVLVCFFKQIRTFLSLKGYLSFGTCWNKIFNTKWGFNQERFSKEQELSVCLTLPHSTAFSAFLLDWSFFHSVFRYSFMTLSLLLSCVMLHTCA